jgi:anaerobic selenocysteine-containing dehydrogenase
MRATYDPGYIRTKLLKESDVKEGGSPSKLMVWDSIGKKLTWYDRDTSFWENEAPTGIKSARDLPGKEGNQSNLPPGIVQGWVPELSDFSRCDPVIDPALTGEYEVTLKDGRTVKCKPAWEYFIKHVNAYDPQTVAGICEVPADDIIKAATLYATPIDPSTGYGNGHINFQLAIEHSCNAIQCARALDVICGITDNLDTPGGGRGGGVSIFNSGQFAMGGGPAFPNDQWVNTLGGDDIPYMKNAGSRSDATAVWDACNRDKRAPYPIYGNFDQSGDFLSNSNSNWAFEGLKQLDFMVCLELWHAPITQLADILLPVRHWLELDSARTSQAPHVGAMDGATCKCVEPLADTWYDVDIISQFCKRMGVPWVSSGQTDDEKYPSSLQILNTTATRYETMGYLDGYSGDGPWEKFKNFYQEQGFLNQKLVLPEVVGTYRRFEVPLTNWGATGVPSVTGRTGFSSPPSRRHEIWSTLAETVYSVETSFSEAGRRDIPFFSRPDELNGDWLTKEIGPFTLPTYTEPPEGPIAQPERAKEYPFISTTGRRIPVYFHNEHRQLPWCRENWPVPRIEINPTDAEKLGIKQGDWVWIQTERTKIRQVADLYYGIRPGTVNLEHSWWMPEFKGVTKGFELVACNSLVNKDLRDPIIGSCHLRAYNVKIYKATKENSPFNNPVPCDYDGTEMITSASDPRLKEWLPVYDTEESRAKYAERNKVQL